MFDIDFYMKFHTFREEQKEKTFSPEELYSSLEQLRNPVPVVYNIETTNACNMACKMCPRTTMMTRRIETINKNLFHKIADQLTPHPDELWQKWLHFIQKTYAIPPDEMSENHFFPQGNLTGAGRDQWHKGETHRKIKYKGFRLRGYPLIR